MQEDTKRKVILILSILISVVIAVLIVYFMFYRNQPDGIEEAPVVESGKTATTSTNGGQFPIGGSSKPDSESGTLLPTPTVIAGQTVTGGQVVPTVTPLQVGDLDWTKKPDNNIKPPTEEQIIKAQANNDPCKSLNLENSWNNPFEKTLCGVTNYIVENILDPMMAIGCNLQGSALNTNYGSNITAKYVNGNCYIEDR